LELIFFLSEILVLFSIILYVLLLCLYFIDIYKAYSLYSDSSPMPRVLVVNTKMERRCSGGEGKKDLEKSEERGGEEETI
jgi:hypothetical protein